MRLLQLYRFPIFIFLCLLALVFVAIVSTVQSSTIILNNSSVVYKTSSGGRWGAFSHDQEILDKSTGKKYIKTYRTFCISNLFVSPQKAIKADKVFLVLPSGEITNKSDVKYYALTVKPQSAVALFFYVLAYIVSNYPYILLPLVLMLGVFKKELSKDYQYNSALHKGMVNAASYVVILLVVLFAIY